MEQYGLGQLSQAEKSQLVEEIYESMEGDDDFDDETKWLIDERLDQPYDRSHSLTIEEFSRRILNPAK